MDAESNLTEKSTVSTDVAPPPSEPVDPVVLKEKVADELKSAATLKGGGDGIASTDSIPLEKDDLLERLDKIDTGAAESTKPSAGSGGNSDVDMENDDLIQRLEAIEKGEEHSSAPAASSSESNEKKDEPVSVDVNHQNGLEAASEEADSVLSDEKTEQPKTEESMEVDGTEPEKKDSVSSSDSATKTPNGDSVDASSSAKRRHSEDEERIEPSSKKLHVEEEAAEEKETAKTDLNAENLDKTDAVEKTAEVPEAGKSAEQTNATEVLAPINEDKPNQEGQTTPKDESTLPSGSDNEKTEVPAESTAVAPEVEDKKEENTNSQIPTSEKVTSPVESEPNSDEDKLLESDSKSTESDDVEPSTESKSVETVVDEEKLLSEEPPQAVEEKKASEQTSSTVETVESKKDEADAKSEDAVAEAEEKVQTEKDVQEPKVVSDVVQEEKKSEDEPRTVEPTTSKPEVDVPKSVETTTETSAEQSSDLPESEAQSKPESKPDEDANNTKTESPSVEDQPTSSQSAPTEAKNEDTISSSSEPKEVTALSSSETAEKSPEPDTVTSSDERPAVESDPVTAVQSESADTAPVAAEAAKPDDEAMEVDDEPDAESAKVEEVAEPTCEKKQAYECTDEEKEITKSTPESESASTSTAKPTPSAEPATQEEEAMEVDSAAAVEPSQSKSSDGDVTESLNTTSEDLIETLAKSDETATDADSQTEATAATASAHNKNLDSTGGGPESESKVETSKTLDDSIECSLPTSSSDKLANRLKQRLDMISNGSSTPNAAVSSSNVYNSTPIQKQFEVSSEDVSKITRHSVDNSRQDETGEHSAIVADNSTVDEKDTTVASTSGVTGSSEMEKNLTAASCKDTVSAVKTDSSLKTTESEVDSCTASSGLSTGEETNLYANNARKFNGISSTSELDEKTATLPTNITTSDTAATTSSTVNKLDLSSAVTSEESTYEVNIWFDGAELQFLSVEKLDQRPLPTGTNSAISTHDLTSTDSSKQSSNGSVGSLGPFSLPPPRPAADSALSHSSTTESSSGSAPLKDTLIKSKHTVRGAKGLANLMIEEFTKIKKALCKDEEYVSDNEQDKSATIKTPRGRPSSAAKKTAAGRKRARTDSDAAAEEDDVKSKPSAAKQAKKATQKELSATPEPVKENTEHYLCCLARWSDRKYYAGKVTAFKGDNKYMVLFEDGASKALSKDVIVIGDKDTLPIHGHSVHALTGGDTYEPGFVTEIKRNEDNEVVYTVTMGEKTVEVTASDMYLNEEQARAINRACKAVETPAEDLQSPQAGGKRGGSATNTPILRTPEDSSTASEKGSRSTRSKRGGDKPQTPATPEAGYSGGVGGKKGGRRGRRLS